MAVEFAKLEGKSRPYYTAMVLAVLLGLFTFMTFIDQLGDLGVGRYGLIDAIRFVVLSIPKTLYEVFPMAALLGAILGLSAMAVDSEPGERSSTAPGSKTVSIRPPSPRARSPTTSRSPC